MIHKSMMDIAVLVELLLFCFVGFFWGCPEQFLLLRLQSYVCFLIKKAISYSLEVFMY